MASRYIVVKGAREHNLKDISIEIPRDKLVVITGLSGSGKSSLAFDTIYAEGQRRYVESMSAYARQFIGLMEKPDVDLIDGLSPAISIEQKTTNRNPRSTVGTVTEIYDYMRLLFARIGVPYCYKCGRKIASQSVDQILDIIMTKPEGAKMQLLAPLVNGKKGEHVDVIERARKQGFARVRIDGEMRTLDEDIKLAKTYKHSIDVVIDRLVMREGIRPRLADSLETALRLANGLAVLLTDDEEQMFSSNLLCPHCGVSIPEMSPRMFSFNSPYGACEKCGGLGFLMGFDPQKIVSDPEKSIYDGAIPIWGKNSTAWSMYKIRSIENSLGFDGSLPWKKLPKHIQDIILYGTGGKKINFKMSSEDKSFSYMRAFEGIIPNLERRYHETNSEEMKLWYEGFMSSHTCDECEGKRLKKEVLAVRVGDKSIADMTAMSIGESLSYFLDIKLSDVEQKIASQILKEIKSRLSFLNEVGIDYLTLDRLAGSLSGGEAQRIRLATQIGSNLTGVLYVLDEPSIGLHQRDNQKLLDSLKRMRDLGNTVIVVEHDEETIREADFVVDLGPGAGIHGGNVLAAGTPAEIEAAETSITGQYLSGKETIPVPEERRKPAGFIELVGAREHNLKNINVKFPIGVLAAVTGVSGSGKSTLVIDILYKALSNTLMRSKEYPGAFDKINGAGQIDKIIDIDQAPIGRTPRSNPATYTGLFSPVRELFASMPEAKARGYKPGRFSFNVPGGRCETCQGDGVKKIEMHFLSDVYITCDVCGGSRYNLETLDIKYKGKTISDVLSMTVEEACEFFKNVPTIFNKLNTLNKVGLGYIKLGQSATTLSGGEAQRVKLATELSKKATGKTLYILDEPTTGLHFADVKCLIGVLQSLVDKGNSVIVIEHNLDVIKIADYIIDMGPEGGTEGGTVIAAGTPEEIASVRDSYTGAFLKKMLKAK